MSRPLRYLPAGSLVEITSRTMQGRMLLRPSQALNDIVLGVLGRAQRRFGMELIAVTVLSNHVHLLARPGSVVRMSDFMEYVLSKLAREVGRLHGWNEKIWGRRYRAIAVSDEPEAQVSRLRYVLENGTKEGLVAHPGEWPGVHSAGALVDGEDLSGFWVDRTAERRANRVGSGSFRVRERVELTPLPAWRHLDDADRRRLARELVDDIAVAARIDRGGRPVLGRDRILRLAPIQRKLIPVRSPAPAVHAATQAVRRAIQDAYRAFLDAYRRAAKGLRAGDLTVRFPPDCFLPAIPVQCLAPD
jgi:REP element-mobilizing transposase RayT